MTLHLCHAKGCTTPVPRSMLMCFRHWKQVPLTLKREVWRTYQPGQEVGVVPVTPEYLAAANAAIEMVAEKERLARRHREDVR